MKVRVPPIKSQGIKTKLVPWIESILPPDFSGAWVEPFMGTGVVAFNLAPTRSILCDTNPHLINFYMSIADGTITSSKARRFLVREGAELLEKGEAHYYKIRDRFNAEHSPLDFLFLNRAGFNGMIRFNRKGEFNIPFCRKPQRFARAYVTKIVNQISHIEHLCHVKQFEFKCQSFEQTISECLVEDIIYCDPPYIDRHVDYYNGWDAGHEILLHEMLSITKGRFILSTWHHNDFRTNAYIGTLWKEFNVFTREHFYHVGGNVINRNPMIEAIVTNYETSVSESQEIQCQDQLMLFDM